MATTYNNLYMDIRQELHRAGIDAATLEARELVAFAAGSCCETDGCTCRRRWSSGLLP